MESVAFMKRNYSKIIWGTSTILLIGIVFFLSVMYFVMSSQTQSLEQKAEVLEEQNMELNQQYEELMDQLDEMNKSVN